MVITKLLIDILQIAGANVDVGLRLQQLAGAAVVRNRKHFHRMVAVPGIICIKPLAPTGDFTFGFQALSWRAIAMA